MTINDHQNTKIVATVGPASSSYETLLQLVQAGVDVFRLNFSHGSHEDHLAGINQVTSEGDKVLPKSQLVTTHTARRSAATNLYLEGASLKTIADLGGWENNEMLRIYLRASGLDSARLAQDLDFFN